MHGGKDKGQYRSFLSSRINYNLQIVLARRVALPLLSLASCLPSIGAARRALIYTYNVDSASTMMEEG